MIHAVANNKAKQEFKIPVSWELRDFVTVQANSLKAAYEWLAAHLDEVPLGDEPEYKEGSFQIAVEDPYFCAVYQQGLTCLSFYCDDMNPHMDSMLLCSGEVIARGCFAYRGKGIIVELAVNGEVQVGFQGREYHCCTEFPAELKDLFKTGKAYEHPDVRIESTNWLEYLISNGDGKKCERDLMRDTPEDIVEDMRRIAGEYFGLETDTQLEQSDGRGAGAD